VGRPPTRHRALTADATGGSSPGAKGVCRCAGTAIRAGPARCPAAAAVAKVCTPPFDAEGQPQCAACWRAQRLPCSYCCEVTLVALRWQAGPVCSDCVDDALANPQPCGSCGRLRPTAGGRGRRISRRAPDTVGCLGDRAAQPPAGTTRICALGHRPRLSTGRWRPRSRQRCWPTRSACPRPERPSGAKLSARHAASTPAYVPIRPCGDRDSSPANPRTPPGILEASSMG
jgi:hypothetical protein